MKSNLILIAGGQRGICPRGDICSGSKDWLHVCAAVMNEPWTACGERRMSTSRGGEEMYGRDADDRCSLQTMSVSSIFKEYMFDPGKSNCVWMQKRRDSTLDSVEETSHPVHKQKLYKSN